MRDHMLRTENEKGERDCEVERIIVHQQYNPKKQGIHDIALIQLKEKVDLNVYIPACIAKTEDRRTYDNAQALVVGNNTSSREEKYYNS